MARDINRRLTSLNARRRGTDRLNRVRTDDAVELIRKSAITEAYQKRSTASKPNTRYALGAMQEVSPEYTRISIETAERVGRQLHQGLTSAGFGIEFRLQGSVPLNTHIRGVSDVDLLNLSTSFFTYATSGARSRAGLYQNPSLQTSLQVLGALRRESEKILKAAYPAVTVDTSGSKAIQLSGGSLARPVDVVPSHWHDTIGYQTTYLEHDRGVTILDRSVPETVDNLPFLHIKRVKDRDVLALGSLKKAIRLCKNVKSDAEEEGINITLGSYDIAAILYHADLAALQAGSLYELGILAEAQRYLDWLYHNKAEAQKLIVPDGSRRIFDSQDKLNGLLHLSVQLDELMKEVGGEQNILLRLLDAPSLQQSRDAVSSLYIPAA
jgi:hypothetical protein